MIFFYNLKNQRTNYWYRIKKCIKSVMYEWFPLVSQIFA